MGGLDCRSMFFFLFLLFKAFAFLGAADVCSNAILLGLKGELGDNGDAGEQGRLGKAGPTGQPGLRGELGSQGDTGPMGKTGPAGERGDKGIRGTDGPPGLKGRPGTTCDCGRYRKVVGQLDVNVGKLKNSVNFLKSVILGIKETDEKFYLIVKEGRKYKDALLSCQLRGGTLAMPKSEAANALIASYINQAGLTHAYIGLRAAESEGEHAFTDSSPLQNFTSWSTPGSAQRNGTCVEMASTGAWTPADCDAAMYYMCEFTKKGRVASTAL
ncbi:collectin-10 isoform X1 [Paramormyrops kingsleyae]|uniref:Collectin subfamily member 10 n=1 Tax=Paramormyrops kingsleyae TaxID=1676925 RepID=A0A3B3Q6A8_9TELE|nr:collectin-10 isoform X1 [Paramormyrops kingsleyae]